MNEGGSAVGTEREDGRIFIMCFSVFVITRIILQIKLMVWRIFVFASFNQIVGFE